MTSPLFTFAQWGFAVLTTVYFYLFVSVLFTGIDLTGWSETRKKNFRYGIVLSLLLWVAFLVVWSTSGIMSDFTKFPFNFMPVIIIPLFAVLIVTFSSAFKVILLNVSTTTIIRLQSFRFFVELLLWALFVVNVVPIQMTFEGFNYDVLTGITAPFIAWFATKRKISKAGMIVWNILCLVLLINIVSIAILSTPTPLRAFMNEPANTIVTTFPVVFLPGLLVPLAYTLHFFSLRQLSLKEKVALA
jgi:hypothetical protein